MRERQRVSERESVGERDGGLGDWGLGGFFEETFRSV